MDDNSINNPLRFQPSQLFEELKTGKTTPENLTNKINQLGDQESLLPIFLEHLSTLGKEELSPELSRNLIDFIPQESANSKEYETFITTLVSSGTLSPNSTQCLTAFTSACKFGNTSLALKLLNTDMHPLTSNHQGESTLQTIARYGHVELLDRCLAKLPEASKVINLNEYSLNGLNCLHLAIKSGNSEMVKKVIHHGGNPNIPDENNTITPLIYATSLKSEEIIATLIQNGADINGKNRQENTPLKEAISRENIPIVKQLLGAGADIHATDESGLKPIHDAVNEENTELIQTLLDHGCSIDEKTIKGESPLHFAIGEPDILKFLLDHGADPNSVSLEKLTPLHSAAEQGETESMELLIDKGAIVTSKDNEGRTPLHYAALNEQTDCVDLLLTYHAEVNSKDDLSATPLHYAAHRGFEEICKSLLSKGASIQVRDQEGYYPIDRADLQNKQEVVTLLREAGSPFRNIAEKSSYYVGPLIYSAPKPIQGINNPKSPENRVKIDQFVQLHSPNDQQAIRAMINSLDYIDFNTFSKQLDVCIEHFNANIRPDEKYLVVVEPRKSNHWLLELSFGKLDTPPEQVCTLSQIEKSLQDNPDIKRIVFFDDASYSGEQLCRFIRDNAISCLKQSNDPFKVDVIVPYMTRWAEGKLDKIKTDLEKEQKGTLNIAPHNIMRSCREQVPQHFHTTLEETYFPFLHGQTLASLTIGTSNNADHSQFFTPNMKLVLENYGLAQSDQLDLLEQKITTVLLDPDSPNWSNEKLHKELSSDAEIVALSDSVGNNIEKLYRDNKQDIEDRLDQLHQKIDDNKATIPEIEHFNRLNDFKTFVEDGYLDKKKILAFNKGLESRTGTIFDHKIADFMSVWPGLDSGTVYFDGEPLLTDVGGQDTPVEVTDLFPGKPPYK